MMHKSRIWLALKTILCGTFILLIIMTPSSSVLPKEYLYIQRYYTWQDAQRYCRGLYGQTDLATIYTKSDADAMDLKEYYAWVCWSNSNFWDFFRGQCHPDKKRTCGAVHYDSGKVYGAECDEKFFFVCEGSTELITQSMKFNDAYKYCEKKGGLVTSSDYDHLNSLFGDQDFPIWIGLQRDGQTWKWSAGFSNYTNWAPDEPDNSKNCVSISSLSKNMTTQDCSSRFPFLCYRTGQDNLVLEEENNLVLVEENKTWEEALEHCRALSPPTSYDLVSIQAEDYDYVMKKLVEANAEEVWTGLRFLAGKWLWVNGADMLYSDLPLCPPIVQHCGILSTNSTDSMEPRDCAERKYFMCYRK